MKFATWTFINPIALAVVLCVGAIPPAQAQTFTLLYTFTGGADGSGPSGLIQDAAGNLYGITSAGGVLGGICPYPEGCGVVFKVDTSGLAHPLI
jgi:hypothetical protein